MVGCGMMGVAHSRAWRLLGLDVSDAPVELRVVSGRSVPSLEVLARRFGWDATVDDWRRVVDSDDVDLVDVCVPGDLHLPVVEASLAVGKHVLCEKPVGLGAADTRFLAAMAGERPQLVTMAGFNYRRIPAVAAARELVADGALGALVRVRATYLQDWAADPATPFSWRMDATRAGNGVIGDLGSHLVDLVQHVTGRSMHVDAADATVHVPVRRDHASTEQVVTTDDAFVALGRLDGGALVTLEATRVASGHRNDLRLDVSGDLGGVSFELGAAHELWVHERATGGWRRLAGSDIADPWRRSWMGSPHAFPTDISYEYQALDMVTAVSSGTAAMPDFAAAARVATVLESIALHAQHAKG
jgi:predicted dehydrogenase